ncbi:P-loop containing nucleoside triphosphate hydrolase [Parasponia andersonii]|uniref:P-loop containing nucleoside triphosphate hydrolase n=1 Tax=Parasponia andersonii TaxID=3476 RepID=A0A2P5B3U3_PARAD|nr:P-loop containing nucleoside triphosphate hydrolase [Parasponia andersonii]
MESLGSSKQVMSSFFSDFYSLLMYPSTNFLVKPVFLRGFSGSLHLVLLLLLFISWLCQKFKVGSREDSKERSKNTRNGWSDERLVTLLDLAIRTIAWGAVSLYLHAQFSNSGQLRLPFLLRVWWGFYLFASLYCLVIDIVLFKKHISLHIQSLVSDVVSVTSGLFFIYVGFFRKKEGEDILLGEPLLNGNSTSVDSDVVSNKSTGDATQTLRQHFFDCTVITIAHRITSVLDSDMVLLLSHGLIEEFDTPARLLEDKTSSFAQLVAEYTVRSNSEF